MRETALDDMIFIITCKGVWGTTFDLKIMFPQTAMSWSVVGKQYLNLFYDVALKKSEVERAKIPFLYEVVKCPNHYFYL